MAEDNRTLGNFVLNGIPPAPAGSEKLEIEFNIDANGILKVTASSKTSGSQNSISIDAKTSGRLSTEDIENMVTQAEKMESLDQKEEHRVKVRERLISYCYELQIDTTLTPDKKGIINICLIRRFFVYVISFIDKCLYIF